MIKHHFKEFTKSFGSQIDPDKSEELRRTKTDIETNLSRIFNLIQNQDHIKKDENPRKDTELVGLIEDFYNQYASLYTLYGGILGEYAKRVPRGATRVSSMSSSSSDSEYFSSEEGDNNYRRAITYEIVNTQASRETKERDFEEPLSSQMKQLESLKHQKKNLELKVESQALEAKKIRAKNVKMHARVFELQLQLKKKEGAVSILHAKLENNEGQALSKIAELMTRINKLEQEGKSLRSQNGKLEEKIRRRRNEVLSQRKDFTEQINVMQQKLDSACSQNKELEAELETEREKVSQHIVRIENLAETNSVERQCFLAKIKELELELESRCNKQSGLEEKLREMNRELERANEPSVCDLRLELDNLQEQKNKLEFHNERITKEYSESIAKLEAQVAEQLNNENKDNCKRTKQRYEQEIKLLGEKVSNYENELQNTLRVKEAPSPEINDLNCLELDFVARKLEEHTEYVLSHVSKMLSEVHSARHWIRKRNEEMKQLEDKVDHLTMLVGEKEEKELLLREKVSELEANVKKLEKNLKEKDEELVALGEMKREAIRQLCVLVEFHRQRYSDHLKALVPKERKK